MMNGKKETSNAFKMENKKYPIIRRKKTLRKDQAAARL